VTVFDVQNRMVDFGIDAFWLSHEPWIVPQPFTPEAGEMWSKEDIDEWIDVLAHVVEEAYSDPEIVRTAPHNQVVSRLGAADLNDSGVWATTWRAHKRKRGSAQAVPEPAAATPLA
jgi:glycine dehydrogenase subunit 2